VKAFLDTSVLVATFYGDHEHHEPSMKLFLQFGKVQTCCAAHSLAEVYSVLTGMPGKQRVSGDQAMLFLGNIREHMTVATLTEDEYFQALDWSASRGVAGGSAYDALLAYCALKSGAKTIYTWNLKDFQRLGADVATLSRCP
jgi:predicted nucleic acid-binding protein